MGMTFNGVPVDVIKQYVPSQKIEMTGKNLFDSKVMTWESSKYPFVNSVINNLLNGGINYSNAQVVKIIHNNPKTIVFWSDGDKTIVSCGEDEIFDAYDGFCAAFAKKMFGSTSRVKKLMKAKTVVSKKGVK